MSDYNPDIALKEIFEGIALINKADCVSISLHKGVSSDEHFTVFIHRNRVARMGSGESLSHALLAASKED